MRWLRRFRSTHPLGHSLLWIGVYIAAVFAGDALSNALGMTNVVTMVLLMGLSAFAIVLVSRSGWAHYYGLRPLRRADFNRAWLYLPLVVIVGLQFTKGLDRDLDAASVLTMVGLMLCVGFLEELIFRGFLFTTIRQRSGVNRAVIISGITFGAGHIVNLGRGMDTTQQLLQIAVGIALGVVLALLFALTGTIVPAIAFHIALNISGNITANGAGGGSQMEVVTVAASVLIALAYSTYLWRRLPLAPPPGALRGESGPLTGRVRV